jgi:hypothetical protein
MREVRRAAFAAAVLAALLITVAIAQGRAGPHVGRCPAFPRNNQWNLRVDRLPVHRNSGHLMRSIGLDAYVHADFGSGHYAGAPIGIPYRTVSKHQPRVPVSFDYADESDRGRYPIPRNMPVEGGRGSSGDRHLIVIDRDRCKLYELYAAYPHDGGRRWHAGSGAVWRLRSNHLRRRGYTSADAAGLPIFPGLARWSEARHGVIRHALRFTAPETRTGFIYPARHSASSETDPNLPAMGQRLRLKRSFDISHFPRQARIILRTLKRYGMILADNGAPLYIGGAPSAGWDNDQLHTLQRVKGTAFEVVDTASLPRPRH